MQSQQIVDYITQNIKNGYTETNLRKHLKNNGWDRAAINDAFKRYHDAKRISPTTRVKRRPSRRQRAFDRLKLAGGFAAVVVLAAVVLHFTHHTKLAPVSAEVPKLSYLQMQESDINIIGGAIGQYTAANGGVLPTHLSITGVNSLVMCNAICDPATSQISSLSTYKSSNVKLMPYVADLAAPDEQTIYLVPGGTCKDHKALGPASSSARAMIILYAANEGSSISQRCVKL